MVSADMPEACYPDRPSRQDLRASGIRDVQVWCQEGRIKAEDLSGKTSWEILEHIAKMHPDWQSAEYYRSADLKEEKAFIRHWERRERRFCVGYLRGGK